MADKIDRWATTADFEAWRNTITRLYIEEGLGLKDVMEVMKREHGFIATSKMYKYRLVRWNLHKYQMKSKGCTDAGGESCTTIQTRRHRPEIAVPVDDAETVSSALPATRFVIRGKRGKGLSKKQAGKSYPLRHLSPPDCLRLPEEALQLAQHLALGLIDMGLWTGKSDLSNPDSNRWWGRTITATQLLDVKKYKQAFDALNSSFDEFTLLLAKPDPGLLQGIYLAVLQLDPYIGQRFLVFAADMAAIKLPVSHPLHLMLVRLREAGSEQLRRYAHRILESYVGALETRLGTANSGVMLLYENLYDTLDYLSHEREMHFVDSMLIHERQQSQIQRLETLGLIPEAQSARMALGFAYQRHELWEEADKLNDNVLEWLQTHPREQHWKELDLWDSLYLRFRCKEKLGTVEDVTRVSKEYIQTLEREVGSNNRRTIAAIGQLQKYYEENGYMNEARELEGAKKSTSDLP